MTQFHLLLSLLTYFHALQFGLGEERAKNIHGPLRSLYIQTKSEICSQWNNTQKWRELPFKVQKIGKTAHF